MLHLDFGVEELEPAARYVESIGARQAGAQYFKTSRTMPKAGHPFCPDTDGEED